MYWESSEGYGMPHMRCKASQSDNDQMINVACITGLYQEGKDTNLFDMKALEANTAAHRLDHIDAAMTLGAGWATDLYRVIAWLTRPSIIRGGGVEGCRVRGMIHSGWRCRFHRATLYLVRGVKTLCVLGTRRKAEFNPLPAGAALKFVSMDGLDSRRGH
ncbi:hypothetical protein BJ684DRAFT_16930 [Piptocephalis cylindrospora]|uniref:Uncharacterized protein n=1 Tax=Piptocephalis cylindrospora TaxID=1907219 RepID=A0A4P9Y226_9FUNG|nr:hypothetical protein BJ684DRAFT_16930 [Piptocephalis cylindrospora]|eukprot:RKP12602.1 hypothetical protein BJ684DRAFT_16930 [Piptocephalis cylindrospora]